MRHGSLFSGIGGFDLASEWMGWENVFHCEWNEFGQKVLKYYWPKAISYHDITKTDFSVHRGRIDILTGGFPCQPYSSAGKRLGKEDERHLWPEMLRAIREIQPTWVVGENVLGLVNWNGGLVFHEVQADLEAEGYEVQPYVLPAASVNAPHRRDRVWFVAFNSESKRNSEIGKIFSRKNNESIGVRQSVIEGSIINSDNKGRSSRLKQVQGENGEVSQWDNNAKPSDSNIQSITSNSNLSTKRPPREGRGTQENWSKDNLQQGEWREETQLNNRLYEFSQYVTNSDCNRSTQYRKDSESKGKSEYLEEQKEWIKHSEQYNELFRFSSDATYPNGIGLRGQGDRIRDSRFFDQEGKIGNWDNFPTVSPICTRDDGISDRLDSITFSKWRNESIKAGGNAIVPQVVYQIFKAIEQYETTRNTQTIKTQS